MVFLAGVVVGAIASALFAQVYVFKKNSDQSVPDKVVDILNRCTIMDLGPVSVVPAFNGISVRTPEGINVAEIKDIEFHEFLSTLKDILRMEVSTESEEIGQYQVNMGIKRYSVKARIRRGRLIETVDLSFALAD